MSMIDEVIGERYRTVRLIGRGGTADVFEARDERTGAAVAVKIVRSNDPEFAHRLVEEARALESLDAPGLVRFLDTGMFGDLAFLVMEYVDGSTLAQSLKDGPLGAPATAKMAASVASALGYVHGRGVVHRDVKPSNILQSSAGETWLADFGIAKFDDATTITAPGTTIGTVVYMAPEQLDGERVGPGADIWSLGIVILECLTGRRVYEGSPSEIVAKRLTGPVVLPPDLPAPWTVLLNGMLDPQPERRLSGAEVAALLETSPYATPWEPRDQDATRVLRREGSADQTFAMPGAAAPRRFDDETQLDQPRPSRARSERRVWFIAGAFLIVGALLYGLISFMIGGSTSDLVATTSSTQRPSTTISFPSGSSAIATLMAQLTAAQTAGSIDPASAQRVSQLADQSLIDSANGNGVAAAGDLQQATTTIVDGVAAGTISPATGTTLEHDLSTLAAALGVAAPNTTTTTTTPAIVVPGPGNGHGHGIGKGRP